MSLNRKNDSEFQFFENISEPLILGSVKRAGTVQPSVFLLKFPCEQVEFRQTPAGVDREDRSELLFPRPDPGSTAATPGKQTAGGNKNHGQGDS